MATLQDYSADLTVRRSHGWRLVTLDPRPSTPIILVTGDDAQGPPRATLGGAERRRILVVEDEYIIAAEMAQALEEQGAEVIGPAPDVEQALALIARGERLDGAVLDVNLRGELVFPVADVLRTCGVPYVFATGYSRNTVPVIHQDAPRFDKPVNVEQVIETLLKLPLR